MSIKNNILNNFLSTATAGALAVGGLASVALAPIAVNASNASSLEIKASNSFSESDKYQVCMYDIDDIDPDNDNTNVTFTSAGTVMTLSDATPTGVTLDTEVNVAPTAAGEYQLSGASEITVWDTSATPVTLTAGQYLMDENGSTFISDGTNLFEIDIRDGINPTVKDSSDADDNAPFTEDSEFTSEDPDDNALMVLLNTGGTDGSYEDDSDDKCEYQKDNYNPLSKVSTSNNAILLDEDIFDEEEEDYEIEADISTGFGSVTSISGGGSEKPGKVENNDLNVSKGETEEILKTDLQFEADGATESQIIYTITVTPKQGKLQRDLGNGNIEELGIGGQFSQQTINNGDLEYVHNGQNDDNDEFKFTVTNTEKNKVTSEKTMDIRVDETTADFKLCGDFEVKAGQDQGDKVILSKGVVKICDSEQTDEDDIVYTITSDSSTDGTADGKGTNVVVYKDLDSDGAYTASPAEEINSFTLEEVDDGDVFIEMLNTVADNVSSETMTLTIDDGESDEDAQGVTLMFTFEDNTDPFVVNNTLNLGGVNQSATITESDLKVDDGDDDYLNLELEVTNSPAFGILKKDGASLGMGSTFEMQDIVDAKISYENTLDTSMDTIGFKATDPSGDSTGFTFRINVTGGTTPNDCKFSDVPSTQPFNKEICGLKKKGVVNGYPDGSYGPNNNVTRGEMAKFVVKAFNMSPDTSNCENFSDVMGNTFENEIKMLKCSGVVGGNNGRYLPNDSITRGEAMKLIVKGAEFKGLKMDMTTTSGFSDVPMDHTFYNEIYKAYSNGIANGQNGNFFPERNITRGEMSKIVYNSHLMLVEKNLF